MRYYYKDEKGNYYSFKTEHDDLIPVSQEEFESDWKNKLFTVDEERRQKSLYKQELNEIKQWFINNDWKVNKIVIGEWETSDERWTSYLAERTIKRNRQDEIHNLLNMNSN